jgi:hypothetical protein
LHSELTHKALRRCRVAVIAVLLAALFAGAAIAGGQMAQMLKELPAHEANFRDKARFVHFELGAPGIWQRATATLRSIV